jgi:hypothetical protein
MKYKAVSTLCCKPECNEERIEGQRYCRAHKNEAERGRRGRRNEEFRAIVADRARLVALQLEQFNASAHTAREERAA